jgi:hypothetical protein
MSEFQELPKLPELQDDLPNQGGSQPKDFHIEEFKALRSEIASSIARLVTILQYVLLLSAAVYVFLMRSDSQPLRGTLAEKVVWLIPTVATFAGAYMCFGTASYIRALGEYLLKVETCYGHPLLGWERHFNETNARGGDERPLGAANERPRRGRLLWGMKTLWILLCVANTAVAIAAWSNLLMPRSNGPETDYSSISSTDTAALKQEAEPGSGH